MVWMEESDAAIVAQVRRGDREAFRELVERHSRALFRLGHRMTGNTQDAEEVVQETFLRAFRRLDGFESRSSFKTWLFRIATNCSLDVISRRRRAEEVPLYDPEREPVPELPLASQTPDPERAALSEEVGRRLAIAMRQLSPVERAAFVLRHFEGMSLEEIGNLLGLKRDNAKNSVFRAVRKIRRHLEPVAGLR
ncbi:MAG: RNA polymerase sigma factor, partial [Terriglobales bacterium]